MAENKVTTVDEKDYEHHLTWRGWLSFIVIALSFSGALREAGPWSAFDFTVLVGKFGKIADSFTFIGKGGIGASEGFMFAITLMLPLFWHWALCVRLNRRAACLPPNVLSARCCAR